MSANQRKNKNKKKKNQERRGGHDEPCDSVEGIKTATAGDFYSSRAFVSELDVDVMFQGRKGSVDNASKVYLNTGEFKSMGISPGSFVIGQISGGTCSKGNSVSNTRALVLKAWPSAEVLKHSASLARFWMPSFPMGEKRAMKVSRVAESELTIMQECERAQFTVFDDSFDIEELTSSRFFSQYVTSALADVVLCDRAQIIISWRGEPLILQFSAPNLLTEEKSFAPDQYVNMYRITSKTTLRISYHSVSKEPEKLDDSIVNSFALCNMNGCFFGGYSTQVEQMRFYIECGLGLRQNQQQFYHETLPQSVFAPSKGLLLHGPRGTGKTLLMNEIAAVLSGSCHVVRLSHDILLLKYQGEAEKALQRIFEEANRNAPSLLLIDDAELLCPQRSSNLLSDLQKRIVSCILTLLDGVTKSQASVSQKPVFVIAATSQPNAIDSAMRRPGRLDREIELGVPSPMCRQDILAKLLGVMGVFSPQSAMCHVTMKDIADVAKRAHGMVGADLLLVCKEAHLIALDRLTSLSPNSYEEGEVDYGKVAIESIEKLSLDLPDLSPATTPMKAASPDNSTEWKVTASDLIRALQRVTPSALREVAIEVPEVHWSDIGGMDTVKQSLREVVEWPLQYPDLFSALDISPPRGVLLFGPPGCSKTLMAKALATESGMNFLAVRGPELLSKWLGDSEKAVQSLFKRARTASPSLIFFDEIDAFATKRGDSSTGVNDRVLSQLLTEIDGVNKSLSRVVIVAATNRPDMLDPALLRPGRIDRKIYVPPPDASSREQILRNHLNKMPVEEGLKGSDHLSTLVRHTEGFSGAEVVSVCNEAAILAIDDNSDNVKPKHLLQAIECLEPQITTKMLSFYQNICTRYA